MRYFFLAFLTLFACFGGVNAHADDQATALDFSAFGQLPIMHEGRIKPLDSFARIQMHNITGDENPQGIDARVWLARIMFDPDNVQSAKLFTIRSQAIKRQLDLPKDKRQFSMFEMQKGLVRTAEEVEIYAAKDPEELTPEQRQLVDLHERAVTLTLLGQSLTSLIPLSVDIPNEFEKQLAGKDLNYLTLSSFEKSAMDRLQQIIQEKGDNAHNYNADENKLAIFTFQLQGLRASGSIDNGVFKIMPGNWQDGNQDIPEWYSPWQLVLEGKGGPDNARYLALWSDMVRAYRAQDSRMWNEAAQQALDYIQAQKLYDPARLEAESYYTLVQPFAMARIFYGLSICALLVFWIRGGDIWAGFARGSTLAAIGFHIFAIAARVYILARPPVGTLYESILFVALICALLSFMLTKGKKRPYAHLGGVVSAFALLLLAPFILDEKDSLGVLVAVLNTNFWLATHVLIITAGYGVCVLTAAMAHFYLGLRLTRKKQDKSALGLFNLTYKMSVLALLLTAVGTVLGGIWADQSWGRFWGWDPKENGALLIVLWLIWAQHGRQGGQLRDVPFMAAMAALNIVVALAWFGVNLLSVGLHSYGFIQGVAFGLCSFCVAEVIVIGGLWAAVRVREKKEKQNVA